MYHNRFPFIPLALNLMFIVFAMSLGTITLAQEATPEPVAPATEITENEVGGVLRVNSALLTIGVIVLGGVALASLVLTAYTSHQAAQGIPLPAFLEFSKGALEAATRVALPIGADLANKTPTPLDDVVIAEIAKASGWKVDLDPETGRIILTAPDKATPNA